jgi:hypothetical protein
MWSLTTVFIFTNSRKLFLNRHSSFYVWEALFFLTSSASVKRNWTSCSTDYKTKCFSLSTSLSFSHTYTHKHTSVASSFPRRLQRQVPPTDLSLSLTHTHTHTLSHLQVIFFTECRSVTEASSNWSHSSKFLKVLKNFKTLKWYQKVQV